MMYEALEHTVLDPAHRLLTLHPAPVVSFEAVEADDLPVLESHHVLPGALPTDLAGPALEHPRPLREGEPRLLEVEEVLQGHVQDPVDDILPLPAPVERSEDYHHGPPRVPVEERERRLPAGAQDQVALAHGAGQHPVFQRTPGGAVSGGGVLGGIFRAGAGGHGGVHAARRMISLANSYQEQMPSPVQW